MATTLTPQELQKAKELKAKGFSTQEVMGYISGNRVGAPSALSVKLKETPTATQGNVLGRVVKDIPQDIVSLGRGVQRVGGEFVGNVVDAATRPDISLPSRVVGGLISAPISAATGLAGEAVTGAARFAATPEFEQKTGQVIEQGVTSVLESEPAKAATNWLNAQDEQTKFNISRLFLPALNLVSSVAPVGFLKGALNKLRGKAEVPTPNVETKIAEVFQKAEQGDVSDATRLANNVLDPTVRQTEVDKLSQAYQDSLVGDRVKVNRLLQEQANDMSRGDVVVTQDQLIRNLADEGIIPDVRGRLADFSTEIRNLDKRQNELFQAYQPVLDASRATASIDDFANYARNSIADSRNLRFELDRAEGQLSTVINNLRRSLGLDETGTLTAKQIDDISREANARSKAYRDGGDTFQADVYSELGRAARSWLNDNIPNQAFRQVNDEWLRLEQLKRTAEAMQNQQVDVGILGRALGSYVTTLTGVTLAAGVSNPFTAVAAGILTKMGGDAIADALRSTRFSPEIRTALQNRLTSDKSLIAQLKQTATTQENKNLFDDLSRMLPPAPEGAPRSSIGSGATINVSPSGASAPRGQVVETVREGAIRQPEGTPTPTLTEQALKRLQDAGVSPDEVQKAIMGGTIGTLLMLYMNDDGSMLPAFGAVLGVASSRAGKLTMLDEALKANNLRREALLRAGKTEKSPEIKALEKQNTSLAKERAKVADSLSPGLGIKDVSKDPSFNKGVTPSTNLLEEAKGKSLEEFVKAQGTPVYHGSNKTFNSVGEIDFDQGFYTLRRTKEDIDTNAMSFSEPPLPWVTNDDIKKYLPASDFKKYQEIINTPNKGLSKTEILKLDKEYDVLRNRAAKAKLTNEGSNAQTLEGWMKEPAEAFGENVNEFVVDFKNPLIVDVKGKSWLEVSDGEMSDYTLTLINRAKKNGNDGVIIKNITEGFSGKSKLGAEAGLVDDYIALSPDTIKTKSELEEIWNNANK